MRCGLPKSEQGAACGEGGSYPKSERNVVQSIRANTGLEEGQRHPLTWIMEACDDIAYSVLDIDDLLKKGVLSPDDVLVILQHSEKVKKGEDVKKLAIKFTGDEWE